MDTSAATTPGYAIGGQIIVPHQGDIAQTGAAVIVNSIGSRASFSSPIAKDILKAAGAAIRDQVQRYRPLRAGSVLITHAGEMPTTRYLFHVVVTSAETRYHAGPELIARVTTRCIQLADLLDQPTIALPLLGSGRGRAQPAVVVHQMLNATLDRLPRCETLHTIIFATTSPELFGLLNTRVLATRALILREQELRAALPELPPALLPLAATLLQHLAAARQSAAGGEATSDDDAILQRQTKALQAQAVGLVNAGRELYAELAQRSPDEIGGAPRVVQLIIATGGSIIENVAQHIGAAG